MHYLIPETGFLRLRDIIGSLKSNPQVKPLIPVSASVWWKGVREGRFPKPVKLSPRTTAWRAEDIRMLVKLLSGKGDE